MIILYLLQVFSVLDVRELWFILTGDHRIPGVFQEFFRVLDHFFRTQPLSFFQDENNKNQVNSIINNYKSPHF